jgi:SAM-dependent methyltransferase
MSRTELGRHQEFLARKAENRRLRDYRAFVGPPGLYDQVAAMQFNLLTHLGLRERHFLLDIGCGSLRAGRLFIPYLRPGHYFGIEPEGWLIEEGISRELGEDIRRVKRPVFSHDPDFPLSAFNRTFDFLVAQSIFSHASQRQIARCLGEARNVMTPESTFAATFVLGNVDYAGDEWTWCATYTLDRMTSLAEAAGLACELIDWPHPLSQRWVVLRTAAHEG